MEEDNIGYRDTSSTSKAMGFFAARISLSWEFFEQQDLFVWRAISPLPK
jgi:hypothetical protein